MAGLWTATCALLFFFSLCYTPLPAHSINFNYQTLSTDVQKNFRFEGDASFSVGSIDISANKKGSIAGSTGRASYNGGPVPLWDKDTGELASFTSQFKFAITPLSNASSRGTGMAFFLASYPSTLPTGPSTASYNLGLTNQSADTVATGDGRFVAVEFDTFVDAQVSDPNTTLDHIGIDVNSLKSAATLPLPSLSLKGNMMATVQYDNVSGVLALTLQLGDGRGLNYSLSSKVDMKSVLPEQVAVGFSAATGKSVELHQLLSWEFSSSLATPPSPSPSNSGSGVARHVGHTAGAALVLVLLIGTAAFFVRRRKNKKKKQQQETKAVPEDEDDDSPSMEIEVGTTGPRRFPYQALVDATRSFAAEEKLGQGGFGAVYRGYLKELDLAVAIKRFSKDSSMQGKKEYTSEIKVISRLRHRNLVQLLGWCHGREELLLVYELMPNRSLDMHLHGKGAFLTWPMRMKILLELGSALLYLHEEWEQCVVHRDIKPSNVMLDEAFSAKLGDFGLARLIDHAVGTQTMTMISGTPGYVDPQCLITGRASSESDVYSFGVVLLEVACGRRPMTIDTVANQKKSVFRLVEWVWDLYGQGAVLEAADEQLDDGQFEEAEVERVMIVGLWCAHPDPSARPSIRAAMAVLQSKDAKQLPLLPAKIPVATYASPVPSSSDGQSGMSLYSVTQSSTTTSGYTGPMPTVTPRA